MKNEIRKFRTRRGWTQPELAEKADTSVGQIARLESGTRRLDDEWIEKFIRIFGCTVGELYGESSHIDEQCYGVAREVVMNLVEEGKVSMTCKEVVDAVLEQYKTALEIKREKGEVTEKAVLLRLVK